MATTYTKQELVDLLGRLSDDFFQAAGQTPESDPQQRSYRAGMSDGFNIARQMAGNLGLEIHQLRVLSDALTQYTENTELPEDPRDDTDMDENQRASQAIATQLLDCCNAEIVRVLG